jgi:putative endonuclease
MKLGESLVFFKKVCSFGGEIMNTTNTLDNTRARGTAAEDIAAEYLAAQGMVILRRNFHFGRTGEMDIIAQDGETLVFVEVKARRTDTYGSPEEAITPAKQRSLRRVAEGYLYVNGIENRECRFDVIAIRYENDEPQVRHLVNAF